MYDLNLIENAVKNAVQDFTENTKNDDFVKIGVSQRHIHLSREDLDTLFNKLIASQIGEYNYESTVEAL